MPVRERYHRNPKNNTKGIMNWSASTVAPARKSNYFRQDLRQFKGLGNIFYSRDETIKTFHGLRVC